MLLRPDVIAILLATVLMLPRGGVGMRIKGECSLPVFGRFYLICRGSARGEAEFCPRWETLEEEPRSKRYITSLSVLRGNNSGILNNRP
jgi:hypothetical protein